jgi:hypothetical protein
MHTPQVQIVEFRRKLMLRKVAMGIFILGVLAFVIIGTTPWLFPDTYKTNQEYWFSEALGTWFAILLSGLYLHNMRYPRCSERYALRKDPPKWFDLTTKCLNCGLKLDGKG